MVLSEEILKVKYRKEAFSTLEIEKGTLLTPSAKQFIADKGIELIIVEEGRKIVDKMQVDQNLNSSVENNENQNNVFEKYKYIGINGEIYLEKPDYMTQIEGNTLILKNNKKIIFRAKVETFLSELLFTAKDLEISLGNEKLISDMESLIKFVNNILISEALDKTLENQTLLDGKTLDMIQDIARNPKESLGRAHLLELTLKNDILIHKLNRLRAFARELETYAVDYFIQENRVFRKDLLQAFNVLSSAIYIIMLKADKEEYKN